MVPVVHHVSVEEDALTYRDTTCPEVIADVQNSDSVAGTCIADEFVGWKDLFIKCVRNVLRQK